MKAVMGFFTRSHTPAREWQGDSYVWVKLAIEVGLTVVALYMAKEYLSGVMSQLGPSEKEVEKSAKKV